MPFYGATKRVLLGAAPVFLPQVGPFSSLGAVNANNLPNRTISSGTTLQSTRRITPAKYNILTLNNGLSANQADLCVFIWFNTLKINNGSSLTADGLSGGTNQGVDGADGGIGAAGGGGGGGTVGCVCACIPCCCVTEGGGGAGGTSGSNGSAGSGGFIGGTPVSSGGAGGAGRAANWASDGYNYVSNLGFDPELVAYPGGFGGDGGPASRGAFGFVSGGGGGGAGGLIILIGNTVNAFGSPRVGAAGGSGGLDGSTMNQSGNGGDGGGIFIFARHYNGGLNGHVDVSGGAGSSGGNPGNSNLYKINPDGSFSANGFATPF